MLQEQNSSGASSIPPIFRQSALPPESAATILADASGTKMVADTAATYRGADTATLTAIRSRHARYFLIRDDGQLIPLPCSGNDGWECEICSPRRKRAVMARGSRANFNEFWSFTFLPDDPRAYDLTDESLAFLRRQISVFEQWIKRNIGEIVNTMRVLEIGGRGGRLHLHLLLTLRYDTTSQYVDNNKLARSKRARGVVWWDYAAGQAALKREGLGVGDFRHIDCDRPIAYVVAYVDKCTERMNLPPRTARVYLRGPDVRDMKQPTGHKYRVARRSEVETMIPLVAAIPEKKCCESVHAWNLPDERCDCICHFFSDSDSAFRLGNAIDLLLMQDYHSGWERVS